MAGERASDRAGAGRPAPFTPGYLLGGAVFGACLWLSVWLLAQVVAPKILASTNVADLQHGVDTISTLMVFASFLAGFVGGAAGAWQSGRDPRRARRAVIVHGVAGPFLTACGFVAVAWLRHEATPWRSTTLDLGLVLAGTILGALVTRRKGVVSGRPPAQLALIAATTLIAVLAVAPSVTRADTGGSGYQDIAPSACTVRSSEDSFSVTLSVASIDLGGKFAFSEEQTRDGKWTVTVSYGAIGGVTLAEGDRLGKLLGASLSLSASGHLTLTKYNTYDVATIGDADSIVRWAVGPYLADVAALPGMGGLVAAVLRPTVHGKPRAPHSTEFALDGAVHLEFTAAADTVNLDSELELGSGVSIELANQSNRNLNGVTDPDEVTIGLDLKTLLSGSYDAASLALDGDGEMTLSIRRQPVAGIDVWVPDTLALAATLNLGATGTTEADLVKIAEPTADTAEAATSKATSGLVKQLRKADIGLEAGPNVVVGVVSRVPELLAHPRTLGALVGYVDAISPIFEGGSVSQPPLDRASRALASSFATDADIAITGVVGTDVTGKFELLMGDVITFGVDAGDEGESGLLVGAVYRNSAERLAVSRTCYADPHPGS